MADLSALIERVEALTGPRREVDRAIQCGVGGWRRVTPSQLGRKHGGYISPADWIGQHADGSPIMDGLHGTTIWPEVPDVTASLDAAVALVERVLPGYGLSFERHPVYGDWWDAAIFNQMPRTISNARKQSAPLALVLATLRALQAQGGE